MEEKEKLILESARRFFFRYGFKKTSMDEIAEDAGVGKGTLYNYFKNKVDLFVRLAEQKREEMLEQIETHVSRAKRADEKLIQINISIVEDIRKMMDAYAMSYSVLYELMTAGMNLLDHQEEHTFEIVKLLEEGEKGDIFKPGDHKQTAELITLVSKTFLLRWAQMDLKDAKAEIRNIFMLIFNGLYRPGCCS